MSKSRKQPSTKTIKELCWSSKWVCQNPNCTNSIMDGDNFIWDFAHIIAYSKDWSRWNKWQEEDNSFENLLVLCPTCHRKIDKNPEKYSIEILKEWKKNFQLDIKWSKNYNAEWSNVSHYTNKNIQPSIALNWRDELVKEFRDKLIDDWKKILIKSDSLLESYFFILSVFQTQEWVWKNIRIIDNQKAWMKLYEFKKI